MFFFRRNNKSRKSRPAVQARKFIRRLPLSLERLEDRTLLNADYWNANAGSGDWDVDANWSLGHVPGSGDTAIINTNSAATITIQFGDNIQVQSVTTGSNDTLASDGSLTVTSGNSTLNGALTVSNSLTAIGSGVSLTANGSTTVTDANLYAERGATLSLPQMTRYTAAYNIFQADGSGSMLDVSALTNVTYQSNWFIDATNGGILKLTGLTSIGDSNIGTIVNLTATGGSNLLLNSNLTKLDSVNVTLDGADAQVAQSWKQLTDGSLTVTGGSVNLAGLTNVGASSLYAKSGGSLTLPGLTSYNAYDTTFQADGAGSVLDVSALTSQTPNDSWSVKATNGGTLKLTGLTSLTGLDNQRYYIVLIDTGGSRLLLNSNVTSLKYVRATLDGTDSQVANLWTAFTNGWLTLTGGTQTLPKLTDLTNTDTYLSGGAALKLPVLTQQGYSITLTNGTSVTIQGSETSLPVDGASRATINVPESTGLTIELNNSGTLTDTTINVGQGSKVLLENGKYTDSTTFNVDQNGSVELAFGTYTGTTTFNVGQGATVHLTSYDGDTTYGGTLTGSGSGTVMLGDDGLNGIYPAVGGLTLNFPGSLFQWTGGVFYTQMGDVTNKGTINLAGSVDMGVYDDGTLYNYGTMIQTGKGNLNLHSDGKFPTTLVNEAGASYLIESDSGIANLALATALVNAGAIRKTAGTGTSQLLISGPLSNTGTIEADSGTLFLDANSINQVSGNTVTGGTWNALNGSTLEFPSGTNIATNEANVSLDGSGAALDTSDIFGNTVSALAGLSANSGNLSITNGANLTTTGDLSNGGSLTVGSGGTLTVGGNFTQTAAGTLNEQVGGAPASGLFGQVAVQKTANLGGTLNVSVVNGFTPGSGQDFKAMTFASASGNFATITGLGTSLTQQLNPTSLDLLGTSPSSLALGLTSVTAPTSATTGQSITVNWQVSNSSSTAATGNWQDSVYLSTTQTITGSSILLGSVTHTGGLIANGSYNASLTSAVPAVPPGNYYLLVQADSLYQVPVASRANDILAASTGQLAVSVPVLAVGTPANGKFTSADQDQYYQVTVPAGGALQIALTSAASAGATALYVSQGTQPTPYSFQESANLAGQPNQSLSVSVASAGTYYILVHSVSGAAATAGYTLTVTQTNALGVTAISSCSGGNAGNVTIEIDGTNFGQDTTASLTLGGSTLNATSMDYVSAAQVFATFNLSGAAVGNYTLTVLSGAKTANAPAPFQVTAAVNPSNPVEVSLETPSAIRGGRQGVVYIVVINTSANDVPAPAIYISSDGANFKMPLDTVFNSGGSITFLVASPTGPAGILRPGETITVPVDFEPTTTDPTVDFNAGQLDGGQPSLQGTLQSSQTGVNVAGLTIHATDNVSGTEYDATVLTNSSFVFGGIGPGTYTFSVDGMLLTAPPQVTVSADQSLTGVALTGTLGAQISGQVLSQSSNAPIVGAAIEATSETTDQAHYVTTDANGNYSFSGLPADIYDLVVNADGYARTEVLGVDVTAGNAAEQLTLAAASSLRGTISLASGGPGETTLQVTASVSGSTDANQTFSTTSTSSTFELTGLGVGTYDVTLSLAGFITQIISGVVVAAGQSVDLGNITLAPASEIDGTVTSTDANNPAGEINVQALQNGTVVAGTVTDSSGNFQLTDLQPGTYTLAVPSGVLVSAPTVTVGIGQTVTGESIMVQPGGTISGTLSGPAGAPIPGMTVYLSTPGGATVTSTTDSNGNYQFTGLPAGSYRVYLVMGGQQTWQTVSLTDLNGTPVTANLSLNYVAIIRGTLTDSSSNPIRDGIVTLFQSGTAVASAQTDSSGDYNFLIMQPGTFDLAAVAPEGTFNVATGVAVASGASVTQDFQAGSSSLTVTVTDGTQSVTGDSVTLEGVVEGVPESVAEATVGAGGTATFSGLVAGNYTVISSSANGDFGQAPVAVPASGSGSASVALVAQASLTGAISDTAGNPISGATVVAQLTSDLKESYLTTTANDGTYSLAGLPPGVYDVTIFGDQYAVTTKAGVSVQTTATVNAALTASTTTINGSLVDTAGNPVPTGTVGVSDSSGHLLGQAQVNADGSFSISSASGSSLTLQAYATGYGLPASVVISAPPGVATQAAPIVLQAVSIDPSSAPSQTASPSFVPDGQAYADLVRNFAKQIQQQVKPKDPPPKPQCQACMPEWQKAADLAQTVTDDYNDVQKKTSEAMTDADKLQGAYNLDLVHLTGLTLLTVAGGVAGGAAIGELGEGAAVLAEGETLAEGIGAGIAFDALVHDFEEFVENVGKAVQGAWLVWNDAVKIGKDNTYEAIQTDSKDANTASKNLSELIQKGLTSLAGLTPAKKRLAEEIEEGAIYGVLKGLPPSVGAVVYKSADRLADKAIEEASKWGDILKGYAEKLVENPFEHTLDAATELHNASLEMQDAYHKWIHDVHAFVEANQELDICENNICHQTPQDWSHDPNALVGPAGYGSAVFVQPAGIWPYTIYFENDGSAAAQDVTVTEQLDPNLDWSTFQLGSFGFGSINVSVPAGLTQYQTTVSYQNADGSPLNVQVSLNFNVQTGLLTATFTSLDPLTGQDPVGVLDGFLPPDNSSHVGEGYVQYMVQPKADLATGTAITQQASVVFDTNSAISTKTVVNTIDAGAPTSSVSPLPATETSPRFTVNWSGQDDPGGSGIASYNIYVSDNGGAYTLWQNQTTQTSATFNGVDGHTYAFYSVATDNVGNVQATPTTAQATTTVSVSTTTPISVVSTGSISALQGTNTGSVLLATFTQGDATQPAGAYTATVAWGNGQSDTSTETNTPLSIQVSGQTISVYGSHTYTTGGPQNLSVTLSTTGTSATAYPTATVAANVTSAVSVKRSGFRYDLGLHEFVQTITITNTSSSALLGALALELTNLSSNATLANTGGTDDRGNPYIDLVTPSGQLAAGQSITVTLYFNDPTFKAITYDTQVWQGY